MSETILALGGLHFGYPGRAPLLAIDELKLSAGERVFLQGPSGSGKSTLLSLIAGIQRPDSGSVTLLGKELTTLRSKQCDRLRAEHVGLIFQQFNLLPYLSLLDNVLLPLRFAPHRRARAAKAAGSVETAALSLLDRLGLGAEARARLPVNELSVGQQQRVAAARALLGQPELLIADEPTSALDAQNRAAFIDCLREEIGPASAILFVSHDPALADQFDRALNLDTLNSAVQAHV